MNVPVFIDISLEEQVLNPKNANAFWQKTDCIKFLERSNMRLLINKFSFTG